MKATILSIAFALLLGFSFTLSAQTTAVWKGGKPGRATDWNCPANWSEGHVPDEFTQVVIPTGANYYPVIQYAPTPIDALLLEGGTKLTIQGGARLAILGETGRFGGITVLGNITNNGTLEIGNIPGMSIAFLKQVQGSGMVVSANSTLAKR